MNDFVEVENLPQSITGKPVKRCYDEGLVQLNRDYWKRVDANGQVRFDLYAGLAKTLIETPYEDAPHEDIYLGGHVTAHRHNHGTGHSIRTQQLLMDCLSFVKQNGRDEFKKAAQQLTTEETECMRLAAFLMRCGRTNEHGEEHDRTTKRRSALVFRQVATGLGFDQALVSTIAELVHRQGRETPEESSNNLPSAEYAGLSGTTVEKKNKARMLKRVLDLAHCRDLVRLYKTGLHTDNIKALTGSDDAHLVEMWRAAMDKQSIDYINLHGVEHTGINPSDTEKARQVILHPSHAMQQLQQQAEQNTPSLLKRVTGNLLYSKESLSILSSARKGNWPRVNAHLKDKKKTIEPDVLNYISQLATADEEWEVLRRCEKRKSLEKYQPTPGNIQTPYFSQQFTEVVRRMLANESFTATESGVITFTASNSTYDMKEILAYANTDHLQLDQRDFEQFEDFLKNEKSITIKHNHYSRLQAARNSPFTDLSHAEMQALHYYTGSGAYEINEALRGRLDFSQNNNTLKEVIITSAMTASALAKAQTRSQTITYRGELIFDRDHHASRIKAAVRGGVMKLSGCTSTSIYSDQAYKFTSLSFSDGVFITVQGVRGIDISALSIFPEEAEILLPPTQVQFLKYSYNGACHNFTVIPVTDVSAMPELSRATTAEEVAAIKAKQAAQATAEQDAVYKNLLPPILSAKGLELLASSDSSRRHKGYHLLNIAASLKAGNKLSAEDIAIIDEHDSSFWIWFNSVLDCLGLGEYKVRTETAELIHKTTTELYKRGNLACLGQEKATPTNTPSTPKAEVTDSPRPSAEPAASSADSGVDSPPIRRKRRGLED